MTGRRESVSSQEIPQEKKPDAPFNIHSYRWLLGICVSQVLLMMVFLNYSAVLPLLQREWGISNTTAGSIFSTYQVGYIFSAVLLSFLADRYSAKYIFLLSAIWSVIANALFALFAAGATSAIILRGMAGLGMGGTYMPGLKLVAERFGSEARGRAVGLYVGSMVLGAALSLSVTGLVASLAGWRLAILATAGGTFLGFWIAFTVLKGMKVTIAPAPTEKGLQREVLRNRPTLLMIMGYTAHMWEMYGMRGWMAPFLTANLTKAGYGVSQAAGIGANLSALVVGVGGLSTGAAGLISDRIGRTRTVMLMMGISISCSLTLGWLFGFSLIWIVSLSLIYGFFVVAESPAFSTGITELVTPRYVGAAMGLQSLVGFTAASLSPAAFGYVLDLTNGGTRDVTSLTTWGWAFTALGLPAMVGPLAMFLLRRLPESGRMAGGKK